ncbi:MAG: dUTP diphosphatase [Myxococcota bacterium]|nr:dUTP diphosphatase [Myxococcota bacterium]
MSGSPTLSLRVLPHGTGLPLPAYETAGAAGLDLRAALDTPLVIEPGERVRVPTGLQMEIPLGFEGQVRARSGLAWRNGLAVINAPGTIDADYRGEVQVLLVNLGTEAFTVKRGERVAQLVIAPVVQADITVVEALPETERGSGGFGSTGTR